MFAQVVCLFLGQFFSIIYAGSDCITAVKYLGQEKSGTQAIYATDIYSCCLIHAPVAINRTGQQAAPLYSEDNLAFRIFIFSLFLASREQKASFEAEA